MKNKVLIPQEISQVGLDFLRNHGYDIEPGCGSSEKDIINSIKDCSGLLIRNARITRNIIDAAPHLRVIGRHGVGVEAIDVEYATEKGIWVTNAPESNFNAVAEHTVMMILVLAKNLLQNNKVFMSGDFNIRHRIVNMELVNKTLGIVGFGRVGKAVAKKAYHGLGMHVIAYDPYFTNSEEFDFVTRSCELKEVFSQSDFITLHLPVTKSTKGLVDRGLLEVMKRTAYLINAARHEIFNEKDFINTIQAGSFAGAAIDVYAEDPPPLDSPMLNLPNIVYTPHNAAHTIEAFTDMALQAAQGVHEVLSGVSPTWPVNSIR